MVEALQHKIVLRLNLFIRENKKTGMRVTHPFFNSLITCLFLKNMLFLTKGWWAFMKKIVLSLVFIAFVPACLCDLALLMQGAARNLFFQRLFGNHFSGRFLRLQILFFSLLLFDARLVLAQFSPYF